LANFHRAPYGRRRLVLGLVLALVGTVIGLAASAGNRRPDASFARDAAGGAELSAATSSTSGPAAVEAGELPWQLAAPISREVVLDGATSTSLLIAGGLDRSGNSDSGIYSLDTSTGRLESIGRLEHATHDAAGAALGGQRFIFGGGTITPDAATRRFSIGGDSRSSGTLPQTRADAVGVTVGATAYVVGGYDGSSLDSEVLATTDGLHFTNVAMLPVPVRYPAAAALEGKIYIFGGQASDGRPVRSVQVIDPSRHTASLIGELPIPLSGSVAANLDGSIYLAGGESDSDTAALRPVTSIFAFDPRSAIFVRAGALPLAVSNAGAAVLGTRLWLVGGEVGGGTPTDAVQMLQPNRAFGRAGTPGAGSPFLGDQLLVADRGNNRLLLLNDVGRVIWSYPSSNKPPPPGGFYFPDDAFFIRHGTAIISNQEENETLVEIAYPSGRILWQYGHPRVPGSSPGYLNNPDDAYLLRNGDVTVADPKNCRVLVIDATTKSVLTQIGTTGSCLHDPPSGLGLPNGDTPLADGNLLISEISGNWIDEYTASGRLVWDCQLPSVGYVSDPQQIGPGRYLVAGYENPGSFVEFNRNCDILYRYGPVSGPGALDQPSLVEQLPSGVLMANDDYDDRIVAIDPATGALVWQYGTKGVAGTAAGLLNTPDGFDILAPGGATPTHTATG
jgi:outer membrane protein assembly factor BamB